MSRNQLPEDARLIKTISHDDIKAFAKEAYKVEGTPRTVFSLVVFICIGSFGATLTYSLTKGFGQGNWEFFIQFVLSFLANFTILLVLHELLHGLAYKYYGSQRLYFGANLKKLIFYAASDQEYYNGREFVVIALLPIITISLLLITGMILLPGYLIFFGTTLAVHALMAQGDYALVIYTLQFEGASFFTMDSRDKKESYFYLKGVEAEQPSEDE